MKSIKRTALLMLVFILLLTGCGKNSDPKAAMPTAEKNAAGKDAVATEDTAEYPTSAVGIPGIEIGISSDNKIMLEEENIKLDFVPDEKNGLICVADSEYELLNGDTYDAYAALAVVKILKVSRVTIKHEDEINFDCGENITVNDEKINGYIYPIGFTGKITEDSAYDDLYGAINGMEYSGYFDEGFASYGITSFLSHEIHSGDDVTGIPISEERTLWQVDEENGQEMLCCLIFNLHFESQETKKINITRELLPEMSRPTKYSTRGTEYEFCYNGQNLSSFYNVRNINIVINADKEGEFAFIESDAPYFMKDEERTIRYVGSFKPFKIKVGEKLDDDEIYDIYVENGTWKKILGIADKVTVVLLILSAVYIIYSINKRRKSGIGMTL